MMTIDASTFFLISFCSVGRLEIPVFIINIKSLRLNGLIVKNLKIIGKVMINRSLFYWANSKHYSVSEIKLQD